jgi:hypothetical protein
MLFRTKKVMNKLARVATLLTISPNPLAYRIPVSQQAREVDPLHLVVDGVVWILISGPAPLSKSLLVIRLTGFADGS